MELEQESGKQVMIYCTEFLKREFPKAYNDLQPGLGDYMSRAFGENKYLQSNHHFFGSGRKSLR